MCYTMNPMESWDLCEVLPSDEHRRFYNFVFRSLKLLPYIVPFTAVIGEFTISQFGPVLMSLLNWGHDQAIAYCDSDTSGGSRTMSPQVVQYSMLCFLCFAFMLPKVKSCLGVSGRPEIPAWFPLLLPFVFEMHHTIGLALLVYSVFSQIDGIKAITLTTAMCLIPEIERIISVSGINDAFWKLAFDVIIGSLDCRESGQLASNSTCQNAEEFVTTNSLGTFLWTVCNKLAEIYIYYIIGEISCRILIHSFCTSSSNRRRDQNHLETDHENYGYKKKGCHDLDGKLYGTHVGALVTTEAKIPKLYVFETNVYETQEDWVELIRSLFSPMHYFDRWSWHIFRRQSLEYLDHSYYEFESHIFFDDAFGLTDEIDWTSWLTISKHVRNLVCSSLLRVLANNF